ncbi:MAG: TonB-dependent receptor [Bacteroidales bacterium]|nr:MAG: TonB-dependent receptor [Bacteroidales bacterium]
MKIGLNIVAIIAQIGIYASAFSINASESKTGKVIGIVIDSKTNQPIEYANISIYKSNDSTLVAGTVSNAKGEFTIDKLQYGDYYIVAQFLGYRKSVVNGISITDKNRSVIVPSINLAEASNEIAEVTIQGERKSIVQKIDKRVVNVSQSLSSVGGTAIDVLQSNSMIKTNSDGDALLRNSTNFLVLIDGCQSPFQGSDALRQVSANSIEKIEVITNPSAKYDAEGGAGIINIITKKQRFDGVSGIVNASYSSNESYSSDVILNLKRSKISSFIGAEIKESVASQYFDFNRIYNLNDTLFTNNQIVDQIGKRPSSNIKAGFEFTPNSKNLLSVIGAYSTNDFSKNKAVYDEQLNNLTPVNSYFVNNERYNVWGDYFKPALFYQHKFKEKGNELSVDMSYTYVNSGFGSNSKDFVSNMNYNLDDPYPRVLNTDNEYQRNAYEIKSDYIYEVDSKYKLELGLNTTGNRRDVTTIFQQYDYTSSSWLNFSDYSNKMTFNQKIFAGYAMVSGELYKINYQLGLRSEFTDRVLDQKTGGSDYSYAKLHHFPTIHLSKDFKETFQVQLSYSRRIRRPVDFYLNPFPSSVSKNLMNIGNPDLVPELTDSYELNLAKDFKKISISMNNYYRITDNAIAQTSGLGNNGIQVISYSNMNQDKFFGSEISVNLNGNPKVKINPTIDLYYMETKGTVNGYIRNANAFSYTFRLNSTIDISKTTRFQINAEYDGKGVTSQGNIEPLYLLTASIRQEFLKKKLSVVLQARNLFKSGRIRMTENGINFNSRVIYSPETNIFAINISYKINNFKRNNRIQQVNGDVGA